MTTLQSTALETDAIDPATCERLRLSDDAGRPPVLSTDETGGAPLRCCLTKARPGDRIALVSYCPLAPWATATGTDPGPYDERGPVFIHATPCAGPAEGWPATMHTGPRVLRAYSHHGTILGGRLVPDPAALESTAAELLTDPEVAVLHVRAVEFGCYMHAVRREGE
ncbi:DUF1203 domain-containing protein [Kitasatospora sp. NPDC051853]|uniref:DUF1203 domain-containing protein n=1 Tax=Kitasatospora sp. NPDC051853 TaxID=3364058 RepID=UPI00379A3AFB